LLSPDAAYLTEEQLSGLTLEDLSGIPHLCPAFVVELMSHTDKFPEADKKMHQWISNGALLGWLIDPYQMKVLIYTNPSGFHSSVSGGSLSVQGVGPVAGFVLNLANVWRCFHI
jgi:Uma2 family endonuclease